MRTFATPTRKRSRPRAPAVRRRLAVASHAATLQRTRIRQILHGPRVQAKLTIGAPDDVYEREADRVADAVMRMPEPEGVETGRKHTAQPRVQLKASQQEAYMAPLPVAPEEEAEELVQREPLADEATSVARSATDSRERSLPVGAEAAVRRHLRGGSPLGLKEREFFEPRFGADFSDVHVHKDLPARRLARRFNARAFTVGRDIFFAAGENDATGGEGRRLLAHELTHVVQQSGAGAQNGALLVQRFESPTVAKIKELLSYGVFDWAITDAEAVEALTLLQGLPKIQQAEFVSDTKFLERLRSNLPAARRAELENIEKGARGSVPPKKTVDEIISKLSYGVFDWAITDEEAIAALDQLKKLSGEQLSVTLSRIDYGRLMENLPDSRKQELIDLLAKGLGTGGIKEKSEKATPGTVLKSLRFTSDHGVMKDNTSDWSSSGTVYPEPEWTLDPNGKVTSYSISHTKDTNVAVDLGFDVVPTGASSQAVEITGQSDVGFLNFEHKGTESGGPGKSVAMTSKGKLPNAVRMYRDKYITWTMKWGTWEHSVGRSGPHSIFVTMAPPRDPSEVTHKRMELAVRLVSGAGTLDPHEIVKQIMFRWTNYNLDVQYSNAWDLADDMETGAQCIDLVRFVQGIIGMVGSPGTAKAVVVFARPSSPTTAIERDWPHSGMFSLPWHPTEPWTATLLDGDFRANNFEAALKFTHGAITSYYPGGVRAVMSTPDEVLRVFRCLVWVKSVGGGDFEIMEVKASYSGGCTVGARYPWEP